MGSITIPIDPDRLADLHHAEDALRRVRQVLALWDRGDNPEADDDWRTDPLGCCADELRAAINGGE